MRVSTREVVSVAMQPPVDETVLRITERSDGAISYVEAFGEIDLPGERALRLTVERALSRGTRCVIFDFRQVSYMDTGTLKVLLGAKSRVVPIGGEVYVLVEDALPKRVIYMARLQSALHLCESVDEALADIALRVPHVPIMAAIAAGPVPPKPTQDEISV